MSLKRRDFINLSVLTAETGVVSAKSSCNTKEKSSDKRSSLDNLQSMTDDVPGWFSQPGHSISGPFAVD